MVLWFLTADGRRLRLTDAFTYRLYAQGPETKLRQLASQLRSRHWVQHAYFEDKIDFATGLTRPALCLELAAYEQRPRLLAYLGALEEDFSFYNCDLDISSYYLYCRKLFPCCWYELQSQATDGGRGHCPGGAVPGRYCRAAACRPGTHPLPGTI